MNDSSLCFKDGDTDTDCKLA
uniref:Uncharacterized protein n=1 Tax=Anguilla anguilla TaxID=7936 RepID=A0A0E9QHL3_ANGAN